MDLTTWVSIGVLVVLALWMIQRTGTRLLPNSRRDGKRRPGSTDGSNTGGGG